MSESFVPASDTALHFTAEIVSAYLSNNHVQDRALPELIRMVHDAFASLDARPVTPADAEVEKATPAQIRKSIRPDALISFIDGKSYKTLKRHLTKHGLDERGYRARYGLPADYPMTSASYSMKRSQLAKASGLGQRRGDVEEPQKAARRQTVSAAA